MTETVGVVGGPRDDGDRMTAPVERGADQLGHPGVEDDLLGVRRTRPRVQHAGHQRPCRADHRATRLDRADGRHAQPRGVELLDQRSVEVLRRRGVTESREAAPEVDRVGVRVGGAELLEQLDCPASRHSPGDHVTEVRPDVHVHTANAHVRISDVGRGRARLVGSHTELARRQAHGQIVDVSGCTSGLRRSNTSIGVGNGAGLPVAGSFARWETSSVSRASSPRDSTDTHRTPRPSAALSTTAARSASVLPIPSTVVRPAATPAARASSHSPTDTTLAPQPRSARRGRDGREVVGLERVVEHPRRREGALDLLRGLCQRGGVHHVERGPEASRDRGELGLRPRPRLGRSHHAREYSMIQNRSSTPYPE